MIKPKLRKIALIAVSTVLVLAILVIVFISPITKYLIEKYDEQYTGREITMDWAYVNPFTGYLYFNDLRIYERESDSIFFSTKGMSLNSRLKNHKYDLVQINDALRFFNHRHRCCVNGISVFSRARHSIFGGGGHPF